MKSALAIVILTALLSTPAFAAPAATSRKAAVIAISGKIDDYERDALKRRFNQARSAGASTIIIEIDTYGGLVTSALDISRFIKRQDDLHTIAFVRDKAISAGALIAMACDEIVMQPSSQIGDCAPISVSSDGSIRSMEPAERAKAESPVLADFYDSAMTNHHDPLLAVAMVSIGHGIRFVENSAGERKLIDDADFAAMKEQGWKPVTGAPDPINAAGNLLTLYSSTATLIGLSKGESASAEALAKSRDLTIVARLEPGFGENAIEMLGSPLARLALIVIFVISLKIAFSMPGNGPPEAAALISLGLLLGIPLLTGYATWVEVLMIFVGLALLAFEIFIFPGHIISAFVGIVLMVGGLIMTFAGNEPAHPGVLPGMAGTWAALQRGLLVVTGGLICSLILWFWLSRYLPRIPYFNRLVLAPAGGDPTLMGALGADVVWPLVGQVGRTVTDLKPGGSAVFRDETVNNDRPISVVSESGFIRAGTEVTVIESRGNRVAVRAV